MFKLAIFLLTVQTSAMETSLKHLQELNPISIAITGSSAKEKTDSSDLEIAVIFKDESYRSRKELQKYWDENTRVYPFRFSELSTLTSPTPFPRNFYFWWTKNNSRTIFGEQIMENLEVDMKPEDWLEVISYERGVALATMLSLRHGDQKTADWQFAKSCLFATVAAINLKGDNISTYKTAVEVGSSVYPEYAKIIIKANQIRKGFEKTTEDDIFQNFEYLNYLDQNLRPTP